MTRDAQQLAIIVYFPLEHVDKYGFLQILSHNFTINFTIKLKINGSSFKVMTDGKQSRLHQICSCRY